ncbi:NAD-binding protein [Streptomyces sp. F63]|uniref:potassium channel family protein n=1 Tax=Streptomyces sp. F63 TaxID=2824887 RepID=UPI001B36DF67|nr:NAD-binding protein [Streptomyces sp. F63]MBQ0984787.1 NAD-binding protein [Streptomyces sp. F63]
MRAIIAGAGRLGSRIARVLAAEHEVTLVDLDERRPAGPAGGAGGAGPRIVLGDACEPAVLEHAGVHTADVLIAATDRDEDNLVISHLAKTRFAVPRVAARVNDPENTWLFDEHWGVDIAVPADMPLVALVEEVAGAVDTVSLLRLGQTGVGVVEILVSAGSRADGRRIDDLRLPTGTLVAAVIREGEPVFPARDLPLRPGDVLFLVSHTATEQEIRSAVQ